MASWTRAAATWTTSTSHNALEGGAATRHTGWFSNIRRFLRMQRTASSAIIAGWEDPEREGTKTLRSQLDRRFDHSRNGGPSRASRYGLVASHPAVVGGQRE
jgi:hypothetical protein